ncbi:MAG TPA: hypothetical protein VLV48_00325, partial [Thermoanaerobaculia bacterium]|nr:hypothetical protein [Thermoanaerobaculia bacterium]
VLVHRFQIDGAFAAEQAEGLTHANAALEAGRKSLDELSYRRGGLAVALGIVVLVLVALAMKIRNLTNRS